MIETDESVQEALILLDLVQGATITEIRAQYLEKTCRDKFQHGALVDEHLQKEFDKYHRAYVTLAKHLSEGDQASDLQYYPPDQVFQFHFNQGVHYFIHRNYIKAGEKFQEAYKIDKTNIPVLLYLGLLLLKRKNSYAAEKYFKEAVQLDQDNDDAWFYLGESYLEAGELRKALTMFETAKTLNPGRHEAVFKIKEIRDRLKVKSIKTKKTSLIQRFFKKLSGQQTQ
jgi:tetratricopeptide (TPR) repeat protein